MNPRTPFYQMITILEPQTLRFNDMRYFIIDEIQLKDNKK